MCVHVLYVFMCLLRCIAIILYGLHALRYMPKVHGIKLVGVPLLNFPMNIGLRRCYLITTLSVVHMHICCELLGTLNFSSKKVDITKAR